MDITKITDEIAEVSQVNKQLVKKADLENQKAQLLEQISKIDEMLLVFNEE